VNRAAQGLPSPTSRACPGRGALLPRPVGRGGAVGPRSRRARLLPRGSGARVAPDLLPVRRPGRQYSRRNVHSKRRAEQLTGGTITPIWTGHYYGRVVLTPAGWRFTLLEPIVDQPINLGNLCAANNPS
jgi:hypothetical protein